VLLSEFHVNTLLPGGPRYDVRDVNEILLLIRYSRLFRLVLLSIRLLLVVLFLQYFWLLSYVRLLKKRMGDS